MSRDVREKIDALAGLMDEFGLSEAKLEGDDWSVAFERADDQPITMAAPTEVDDDTPAGTPVVSPMTGIYYEAASPGAKAYVQEGDTVSAGQVVGLIEAMKVFNEITSPVDGVVTKIAVKNGDMVNPSQAILWVA